VKLEVMGKVEGSSEVPRCEIGSGGESGWAIGCAQV
jgi:hypothetical protein